MKPQIINAKMNRLILKGKLVKAALFAATIFMVALMTGSIYLRDRVYITDNGVTKELMTSETDVYAILRMASYELGTNDKVSYEATSSNTAYITIYRAFDVNVSVDGETRTVAVIDGTVEEILEKAGVSLGEFDEVSCALTDKVYEDMEIAVTRVDYVTRENTEEIAFDTEYIDNTNRAIGDDTVITPGEAGERVLTVKEKYVDGKLAGKELISDKITRQPVTEVVERGTALAVPYSKMDDPDALTLVDGIPQEYTRVISGKATAYTAKRGAYTASGRLAEIGTCAVNPNVIPYGSKLYIVAQNGSRVYGYAVAADTGIALMDGTVAIDLYFGNKEDHYYDSCRWGAVQVDIYVLEEGNG
ncbi:MAG: G5 domain-containing protein [Oscillospiraceae bacterium]|nr:G5 domain-containing protein [Oscillospiraceae bacterium]